MKNNFYTLNGDFIKEGHVLSSTRDFTGFTQTESGDKTWYKDGFRHRLDGPALEWYNRGKEYV